MALEKFTKNYLPSLCQTNLKKKWKEVFEEVRRWPAHCVAGKRYINTYQRVYKDLHLALAEDCSDCNKAFNFGKVLGVWLSSTDLTKKLPEEIIQATVWKILEVSSNSTVPYSVGNYKGSVNWGIDPVKPPVSGHLHIFFFRIFTNRPRQPLCSWHSLWSPLACGQCRSGPWSKRMPRPSAWSLFHGPWLSLGQADPLTATVWTVPLSQECETKWRTHPWWQYCRALPWSSGRPLSENT